MNKKSSILLFLVFMFVLINKPVKSQLVIDQTLTDVQLAQSLVGSGVTISNVNITCGGNSYGRFEEGTSNLGISEGVLLTTGIVTDVANPSSFFMSTTVGTPGDPTLNQLVAPQTTNDACVMEFNVIPQGDTLRFRYRFGSEEYPDYVCSEFNDVFGFFITGPDPAGGNYNQENIAIIPGTNLPVAINSINSGVPGIFGTGGCTGPGESLAYSSLFVNNELAGSPTFSSIVFDGITTILTAEIEVVPCQTYTLKLAVADVFDGAFNSGVFIEEISSPEIFLDVTTEAGIPFAVAGCNNGIIEFSTNFTSSDPITIFFDQSGTALPGINYNPLPDSVVIQPGDTSVSLLVEVLVDSLNLGGDSLTLSLINPCTGQAFQSITLFIQDNIDVQVPFADTTVCAGETVQLDASGAFLYNWTPEATLSDPNIKNPIANPLDSTLYTVVGRIGLCPPDTAEIMVNVIPIPQVSAGPDQIICTNDTLILTQAFSDADTSYWSPSTFMTDPTVVNAEVFPTSTIQYILTGENDFCVASDTVEVSVATELSLTLLPDADTVTICEGEFIQLSASGAPNFTWEPATGLSDANISNPVAFPTTTTTYVVTGTSNNCPPVSDTITIEVIPVPELIVSDEQDICIGDSVQLFVSGATDYSWTPNSFIDDTTSANPTVFPETNTQYVVTVVEGICVITDTVLVNVNPLPTVNVSNDTLICLGDTIQLTASGGNDYSWSPDVNIVDTETQNPLVFPDVETTYTVTVINTATTCVNSAEVTVDLSIPEVDAGTDVFVCPGETASIGTQGLPGYTYVWSPEEGIDNPNVGNTIISLENNTEDDISSFYYLTATSPEGCSITDSIEATVFTPALTATTVDPQPDSETGITTIFQGETVQLEAIDASDCVWSPDMWLDNANSCSPIATPDSSTWYYVTATNMNGCTGTDSVFIEVEFLSDIFVPNAFAPGRGGENATINVFLIGRYNLKYFRIFNRWGELVFETNDDQMGWNGTFKGSLQPNGTYVYFVRYEDDEMVERDKTGTIHLLK
ncbi:MAG: gliding motility-associated C-terminal domain-containing protein [Chitinophagaceae bacterium]|nr:MAG: gliding motility-associated C-terminal domain-containing protein [Chitinophagaceae bacterium]